MCELFAMSAGQHYTAQDYLPRFADKARDNMSGWGIGFFREGQVHIEKSCEGIYAGDLVHDSFRRLARVIGSRIIISHIRCPNAGHQQESEAQPLTDFFLDHHWLFSFTGESQTGHGYDSPRPLMRERLLAARVFEFVRDGMEAHQAASAGTQPLPGPGADLQATHQPVSRGIRLFSGQRDGALRLSQPRRDPHLPPAGGPGRILVLTTVAGGLTRDPELWFAYPNQDPNRGQILIISGADLLYQGQV